MEKRLLLSALLVFSSFVSGNALRLTKKGCTRSQLKDYINLNGSGKTGFDRAFFSSSLDFCRGKNEKAIEGYLKILSGDLSGVGDSDFSTLYYNIGFIYSILGDKDNAIYYLKLSLGKDDSDYEVHNLIAKQYKLKNNFEKAIESYQKSIEINKKNVEALIEMAEMFVWADKEDDAISTLELAREIDKKNVNVSIVLANSLMVFGRRNDAKKAYKDVVSLDSNCVRAWYSLGCIYINEKDYNRAILCFSKVIKLDPENVDAAFGLSKAFLEFDKGTYQDVVIKNVSVSHGERHSESRYEFIKDFIGKYNRPITLLDIGASEGYFSFRLAQNFKDSVFVMAEPKGTLSPLCKLNSDIENVIFLKKTLNLKDFELLEKCEHFDVVLALSVVHWFGAKWRECIEAILKLGDNIIIDVPPVGDVCATGTKDLKNLNDYLSKIGKVIGKSKRHTTSHLKCISNLYLIEGEKKEISKVHWLWEGKSKSFYNIESNFDKKNLFKPCFGNFAKKQKIKWIPGINLLTFKMLNGKYPTNKMLEDQLRLFDGCLASDFTLYNFIVQGNQLKIIDQDEGRHIKRPISSIEIDKNIRILNDKPENITEESLVSASH